MKKFVMTAALAAGALFASSASAQTVAELQALIAQLQAQLGGTTTTSTTTGSFVYAGGILKVGSRGQQVMDLQKCLAELGQNPSNNQDGIFGSITKSAVMKFQAEKGVAVDGIIGPVTGPLYTAACAGKGTTTTTTTTSTTGEAGDLTVSTTSTDVEDTIKEGTGENVLGLKLTADGSDIALTSVKVTFEENAGIGSYRFDKYADEVMIMLGDEEVGSADADEFTKDGTLYSKSINLDKAIVKEDKDAKLYVAVKALSSVDDVDQTFDTEVTQLRYVDGTGMAFTADLPVNGETFGFDDAGADDGLSIKSSSDNPDASTVKVETNSTSDDTLVLAFRLEADEDGADIVLTELPVEFTIANNSGDIDSGTAGTQNTANIEDIIDSVVVTVDGDDYDADLDTSGALTSGNGTATYLVEFDGDEATIDAGDTVDVEVTVTFKKQDGKYNDKATVTAKVTGSQILAEGEDDVTVSGTANGKAQTLDIAGATVDSFKWTVATAGNIIDFTFDVESDDEDFTVNVADIIANDTISGTATVAAPVLSVTGGDADEVTAGSVYTVLAGDSATFRVRYSVSGTNGQWAEVKLLAAAGVAVDNDTQTSPTATLNVN